MWASLSSSNYQNLISVFFSLQTWIFTDDDDPELLEKTSKGYYETLLKYLLFTQMFKLLILDPIILKISIYICMECMSYFYLSIPISNPWGSFFFSLISKFTFILFLRRKSCMFIEWEKISNSKLLLSVRFFVFLLTPPSPSLLKLSIPSSSPQSGISFSNLNVSSFSESQLIKGMFFVVLSLLFRWAYHQYTLSFNSLQVRSL